MATPGEVISAHFGEIALKGMNRPQFERRLIDNIRAQLGGAVARVEKTESRLVIEPADMEAALSGLGRVFGIEWFSPALSVERDADAVVKALLAKRELFAGKAIRVEARRADKSFPMTSPEFSRKVALGLEAGGLETALKGAGKTVLVEILRGNALVSYDKREGAGGLPYGCSGRLLSLLSGGIDSPVASWMMMRRGCSVDFLHFHAGRSSDEVKGSKMVRLAGALRAHSPAKMRLWLAPYNEFYKRSALMDAKSELVLFRRFMLRVANRLAEREGHLGIVAGDSVGQVASQTLENLLAANGASALPVYRPLAGMGKQEITDLARRIGAYAISIERYKDCCSLVAAKHPSTRVRVADALKAEEAIGIGEIVEKTLGETEVVEV